jgi:hypothetical protein
MQLIARVSMRWNGILGAPGYSNFHFREFGWDALGDISVPEAQSCIDRVDDFAEVVKAWLPYNTNLTVSNDVEIIDAENGELVGSLGGVADAPHVSPQALGQTYAGPVGAVVNWKTGGIRNGRRIKGRTFLVPLNGGVFDTNGTLAAGLITSLTTGAAALAANDVNGDLGVWARPTAPGATDGVWTVVSSSNVPDLAAVLRSRRD